MSQFYGYELDEIRGGRWILTRKKATCLIDRCPIEKGEPCYWRQGVGLVCGSCAEELGL